MAAAEGEEVDLRFFQRGNKVWVRNPYKAGDERYRAQWMPAKLSGKPLWVPGEVLTVSAGDGAPEISVQTSLPPRVPLIVPAKEVLPMNQVTGLDQMADFSHLHDAAILYNVQRRFLEERPFTHAGQVLLSVNPHRVITDRDGISIFDPIYMHRYRMRMPDKFRSSMPQAGREAVQLPPHVYDAVEEALTNLRSNLLPQAIVLRGESGSGKSENAKHMVTYMLHSSAAAAAKLAEEGGEADISSGLSSPPAGGRSAVQSPTRTTSARLRLKQSDLAAARADAGARSGPLGGQANPFYSADLGRVEQRVLGTETALEAFSHAGTHANRNASRALRSSKYHFHPNGRLVCAQHSSFLLDISRITHVPYVPGASWTSSSAQAGYKGFAPHTNYHVFYYLLAGARRELRASLRFGTGDTHAGVQVADAPVGYRYLRPAAPKDDVNMQQAAIASGSIGHEELSQIASRGAVSLSEAHADKFEALCEALAAAGVEGEAQYHLWHAVAGILHLGNITFTAPPAGSGADAGVTAEPQSVEHAASVLGVTREALLEEVTFRAPVSHTAASAAARTRIKSVQEAQANVDGMARRLYLRLFNWLVAQMNAASRGSSAQQWQEASDAVPELPVDPATAQFNAGAEPPPKEPLYVSVLDTPGFEMMPGGGVEGGTPHDVSHLFANHVSERLHAEFVDRVFKSEQRVYEAERIDGRHIQYAENKDVLASMENPRTGLLMMLEEQSSHRRATDQALLHKLHTMQKRNPAYVKPGNRIVAQAFFALRHTPAAVTYSIDGTLSSNRVQLQDSISTMLESSSSRPLIALLASNSNVSELLGSAQQSAPGTPGASVGTATASGSPDSAGGGSGSTARTPRRGAAAMSISAIDRFWGSNFSQTLDTCLAALRGCEVHFVLCLRPNVLGAPNFVEPALLHHQLVYSNVMHTVALKHSGFSYRTIFEDFYARFIIIAQQSGNLVYPPPPHANMRALSKELLQQLVTHPVFEAVDVARSAQLGVSKIFLRKHMIDTLNALREVRMKAMDRMATKAQSMWKGAFTRLRLRQMWRGLEQLQVNWRTHMHRAAWLRRLWAARRIQHAVRGWRAQHRWNIVRDNVKKVQGWYKSVAARRRFQSNQNGLRLLHTLARGYIVRQHVLGMLENVVKLQTVARDFLVRNKNYYRKARAAARIQAAWRGYKWRWEAEDVLEYLALKRLDRAMDKAAAVLQAFWRGVLVWRRYNQIRNAALTIQRYIRSKAQRAMFLRLRSAVRLAQHVARTHLRHKETMRVANLRSLADELWRLQLLRERECQDLAEANGVEAVCGVSAVRALALQGTRGTHVLTALLDVDCAVDVSDVYSTGFVRMYDELVTSLTDAGHRVAGLAVGGAHVMVLTDHGVVYSWGFGDRGQAGHGEWEPTWTPRRVETLATGARASHVLQALEVGYKAARIAAARSSHANAKEVTALPGSPAGSKRALASASAYADLLGAAGVNSPLGLLGVSGGVPEPGMSTPFTLGGIKRALKSGVTIKQIAAGEEHSLALTTSGAVFAWGEGRRGQLGLGSKVAVSVPTPVAALQRKVSSITAGSAHSAALLSTGGVMVWGAGPCLGIWAQPAVHSDIHSAVPQVGPKDTRRSQTAAGRDAGPDLRFLQPWLESPPADDKQWAQLLATIPDMPVPQLVRILRFDGDRVRHLEAGGDVTAATTAEGRVFTWGVSKAGALGHGDTDPRLVPTLVRGLLPPPPSSRASPASSPASPPKSPPLGGIQGPPAEAATPPRGAGTAESKAESPGDGASVMTATTGATGMTASTGVSRAAHYRINMTAVGITHCVAVGATGRVFVWGGNQAGQLGLGDTEPRLLPTKVKSLALRRVVQASASARSTHVLTDFNEVLAWGAAGSMRSPIATTAWDAPWGAKPSRKNLPSELPVNTVFRTLVPLEVPIHEVPSRVPKRLLGGKSRALGVTGLVYSQAPLNDAQAHSVLFGLNKANATPADPLQLSLNAAQASAAHEAELMHSAAAGAVDAADLLATASRSTRRLKMAARLQAKEKNGSSPGRKVAPLRFGENSMFDPALVSVDPVTDLCKAVELAHEKRTVQAAAGGTPEDRSAKAQHGAAGVSRGAPLRDGQIRSALDGSVGRPITPVQMASQLPQCGPRVAAALLGGLTPQRLAEVTIEQLYVLLAQLQKHSRATSGQVLSGKLSRAGGRASVAGWGVSSTPGVSAVSGHKGDEGDAKPALPITERKRRKYRAVLNALEHTAATSKSAAAAAAAAAAKGEDGPAAARSAEARRRAGLAGKTPSTPEDAGAPRDALQPFSHSRGWASHDSPAGRSGGSKGVKGPTGEFAAREAAWTSHFAHSPAHKARMAGVADDSPLTARGTGTYTGSRGGAPAGPRVIGHSDGRAPAAGQSASDAVDSAGRSSRRDQLQSFTHGEATSTGELSNVAHALAVATAADAMETPEHDELYEERNRSPAARRRRAVRASLPDLGPMGYKGYLRDDEEHSPPKAPQPRAASPTPSVSHDEVRLDSLRAGVRRSPRAGSPEAQAAAQRAAQRTPARRTPGAKPAGESPMHALFSPAHLVATSNDDMEYRDIVAAYHRDAEAKAGASPSRRPPAPGSAKSPRRVFATDAERKSRRLEGLMSPASAEPATASPPATASSPATRLAPAPTARSTPDAQALADESARNRRASEVRAAFPRAMGHQSSRPPAAGVPASPGLAPATAAPPAMPDLSAAPKPGAAGQSPSRSAGSAAPVTVRSLVRTASDTMTSVAQSASAANSARASPAASAPVARTQPSVAAPAPAAKKSPAAGSSAAAAEAARNAVTRALSRADDDVAARKQMEAELAASEAELQALKQQRAQQQATPSAEDVRRDAAAAAAATWEAGERQPAAPTGSPRPMPSLGELLGRK